jgi:type I restriction enzyme S subunit
MARCVQPTERVDPTKNPQQSFSYIDIASVDATSGSVIDPKVLLGADAPSRARKVVRTGDVIFATTRPYLRNVATVPPHLDRSVCSTGFCVLRASENIDPNWLYWACRSSVVSSQLLTKMRGANYPAVTDADTLSTWIPIPPYTIQRRIVARIEALLAKVKEARALAAAIRRDTDRIMDAGLEEVFGKIRQGFEITDTPKKQIKPIEKVAHLERGKFSYRPRNERRFFGGAIPWVQIQNIPRDYRKYITDYMDTLNEDGLAISKLFPKGTLVVSIAATIGAVGILSFDACFPDSLVGVTPDISQIEQGFLYWQLCYLREHLDTIAPAAAQKNVNLQILSRINLWAPSILEQKAIDTYLSTIQAEVEEMRHLQAQDAELLDQLEQSILERAFRGEL